jgi:RNA polymerase sigma-70 factor (ECF subfamily)
MTIWTDSDEAGMIAAILAGEIHLYHDLIRPHERIVYVMAFFIAKSETEAEEIAQGTFLRALRNLSQFRPESKFGTWLITVALNEAKGRLCHQSTMPMEFIDVHFEEDNSACPALLRDWREISPEVVDRYEIRQILLEAVAQLPRAYREVFVLRNVGEFSTVETAKALGISVTSVEARLHRARMMLQNHLCPLLSGSPNSFNNDSRALT